MAPPQPIPVITLRLSHPQLLDAVLSSDGQPLYSFETAHNQTTLLRCIPDTDGLEQVAIVTWPQYPIISLSGRRKEKDNGVRLALTGSQIQSESEFLRLSTGMMHSSRKFNIPGLDRSLKWRRFGSQGVWECTSPTTSTPVATFEPANLTSPAKIKIYCTDIIPPSKNFRVSKINGVCTTLMDYVVLTVLLLLTNKDDWKMYTATSVNRSASISIGSNSPTSSSPVSPISPITPFSASQSPSLSGYDARSWYSSTMSNGGNGTFLSTNSSLYAPSSTGTMLSTRSSSSSRHRPRTSPSSGTLSALSSFGYSSGSGSSTSTPTSSSAQQQRTMRRAASQYVRPGSQWSSYTSPVVSRDSMLPAASISQSSLDDEEDFEESPVLDIGPTHRSISQHTRSYSNPSHHQQVTPTRHQALRVQVPITPTSFSVPSAAPTSTTIHSAYPHITSQHLPFLKMDPAELPPPPPYEEIEWTVRVKPPRRVRSTVGFTQ